MASTVRTRFAPSPTGYLHIGNLRTALFNWLFARRSGGSFILRVEDTDVTRSSKEFERCVMEDLRWLGMAWDEGPDIGGDKGPYRQSERLGIYKDHCERLIKEGRAYRCYCSKERLEDLKISQSRAGVPPRYDGRCKNLKEPPAGAVPAVRFKVPEKTVTFIDGVHGRLSFDSRVFGDFVIVGSDGIASYNFAVVLDDALMEITHILRGDDHISNTPRQILLFEALGFNIPSYSHIPLVLSPDKTPLGKRQGGATLRALREDGFLPDAVLNATARLGWSFGTGFLTLEELAAAFSIDKLSVSPSVFDMERLKSFNKAAIERLDSKSLLAIISDQAKGIDEIKAAKTVDAVKSNAVTLKDIKALVAPFLGEPVPTEEARSVLSEPYAKAVIQAFLIEAEKAPVLDAAAYKTIVPAVKKSTGEKGKRLFMPIRCALTGLSEGIELEKVMELLGKETVIKRLNLSIKGL